MKFLLNYEETKLFRVTHKFCGYTLPSRNFKAANPDVTLRNMWEIMRRWEIESIHVPENSELDLFYNAGFFLVKNL